MTRDELILGGYQIFQSDGFRFGTDAVLLYHFIESPAGKTAELCGGNGAVSLMLAAGGKSDDVTSVEIQRDEHELLRKSIAFNGCEKQVFPCLADIREIKDILLGEQYDTVCANPPYFKRGSGILPTSKKNAIARHELCCDIDDVFSAAAYLLKTGGVFYMIHRRDRQKEILEKIKIFDLAVVELQWVFSTPNRQSGLFLLKAVKGGDIGICKESAFTVQNQDHTLSRAYLNILNNKE